MGKFLHVEDLTVYRELCQLHVGVTAEAFEADRGRCTVCIGMLNGLERSLERRLPARERCGVQEIVPNTEHKTLNTGVDLNCRTRTTLRLTSNL